MMEAFETYRSYLFAIDSRFAARRRLHRHSSDRGRGGVPHQSDA